MSPLRSRTALVLVGAGGACLSFSSLFLAPSTPAHASVKDDRAAGHVLFQEKGCAHCHGIDGIGGERGPSLLGVGRKLKSGEIQHQIEAGGGGMPAFADALTPPEIGDLVSWLETQKKKLAKQKGKQTTPPPVPPSNSGGSDDR